MAAVGAAQAGVRMSGIASPMLRSPSLARTDRADPWRSAIEAWRRIPIAPKLVGLAALKLALLVVFLVISNQGVAERFASFWERGHVLGLVVFSGVWVISLAAVAIAAFLPAFWMRLLWSIPIALSTFAGVLSLEVTKTHLTFFNVALYWAERAHMGDATEFYATWVFDRGRQDPRRHRRDPAAAGRSPAVSPRAGVRAAGSDRRDRRDDLRR